MSFCDCTRSDQFFDADVARRDLKRYRKRGAHVWTKQLLAAIEATPLPEGATLLDIGGGVGAIHHHLLERGFSHATQIDASIAYLDAAKDETQRVGHIGRVSFRHGDLDEFDKTPLEVDVVTLDRVVCCDPDYRRLLGTAAGRARRLVGFTYPRDRWLMRWGIAAVNAIQRIIGKTFRAYVHPPQEMAAVLEAHGLKRRWSGGTWMWAAEVFER